MKKRGKEEKHRETHYEKILEGKQLSITSKFEEGITM
jgi:hypothetical protein